MSLPLALKAAFPGIDIGTEESSECVLVGSSIAHWSRQEPKPDEATLLAAYDPLPDAKAFKKANIRATAKSTIEAKWPMWRQNNCAIGVYPDAVVAECSDDIASVVAASNAAEDAIDAATTVSEVEAVTATWPVL